MEQKMNQKIGDPMGPVNEIRVALLGDGDDIKDVVLEGLCNGRLTPMGMIKPDDCIVIHQSYHDLNGRIIRVNCWGFTGPEILHSIHHLFMNTRTLYVILMNTQGNSWVERVHYWLKYVSTYAPGAPMLLLLNSTEDSKFFVDDQLLKDAYSNLTQVLNLPIETSTIEEFNAGFTEILLGEIQKTGFLDDCWPMSWRAAKNDLNPTNCDISRYMLACAQHGVKDDRGELLNRLIDLGYFFRMGDSADVESDNAYILDPRYFTKILCRILFYGQVNAQNGVLTYSTVLKYLNNILTERQRKEFVPVFWDGLRKLQISFQYDEAHEFIPILCRHDPTLSIQEYQANTDVLEFSMEFEYLPMELLRRLIVERHLELDINNVWRTGARFHDSKSGTSAVVAIDGNVLQFFCQGSNKGHTANNYLNRLIDHVEIIRKKMGLSVPIQQIVFKRDGKREVFDYEQLNLSLAVGQSRVFSKAFRKMIAIEDILNQAGADTHKISKLEDDVTRACAALQTIRLPGREDEMNRQLKLNLQYAGYNVADSALLMGGSSNGKHRGEPDLFLLDEWKKPLTVIEAMNIRDGTRFMRYWDEHLSKLLHNHNPQGLSPLFLICYVDCEKKAYDRIFERFREHLYRFTPDRSELLRREREFGINFLNYVSCRYLVSGKEITVYHYFVRVETSRLEEVSPKPRELAEEQPKPTEDSQQIELPAVAPEAPQHAEPILRDYRVVLLGDSEAGKTLIQSRLDNPDMDPKDFHLDTTIGINIVRKVENINGQTVRLNIWDFGGQDILHSMHRIFLAKNTLYVIVLNTRNNNQDAQAIFWLRYVEAYAPGSPVLLVMNKIDQNKRAALNLPVLRRLFSTREFEREDVLQISAVWPEKEKFQKEFTDKLYGCIGRHISTSKPFTSQELRIRDRVEEKKATEKLKVISIDDFRDICEEASLDDEDAQDVLMERFNEAGVLVYFQSKTVMFMNPEWITKTIYKILDQDEQISDNGVVPYKKIQSFCRKNEDHIHKSEDAAYLVDIMRDYDLSFRYEKQMPGVENTSDKEFIPMLCQREEPQDIDELICADDTVKLRMVFEYLPCGVLYKLMVDHQKELDMGHVWLTGMKLDRKNGSYAILRQEGNTMGIYVHDDNISDAVEWMTQLKTKTEDAAKHDKFNATLLETKLRYEVSDIAEYFDYQQLKNAEESNLYYTVSRSKPPQKVSIRDILAQKDGTVLETIKELLKLTSEGCQELQGRHTFWFLAKDAKDDRTAPKMDEDSRTAEIRSVLRSKFTVKDQPRWGDSSGGVKQGELDLWIGIDEHTPLAVLEALNISTSENAKSVASWKEHLTRMMCDYNKNGINNLLLVSYLNCPLEELVQTRRAYFERMRDYEVPSYGAPKYCEPIVVDEFSDGIQVVRADYSSGAGDVTVYHFLVRIEQYGRKALEKAQAAQS